MELGFRMSQEHSLRQSLSMEQRLEARLSLEQKLAQRLSLEMRQAIKLELREYRQREKTLTKLYGEAAERGDIRHYAKHSMDFHYALVAMREAKQEFDEHGGAFSHCLYNTFEARVAGSRAALLRGDWMLFVARDAHANMPQQCIEYAAVHERGEQLTLGDHHQASKLEFAVAHDESRLGRYIEWLEQYSPSKFADVSFNHRHLIIPDFEELREPLRAFASSQEATIVKAYLESFQWPERLLKLFDMYAERHDQAMKIIRDAFAMAERRAESLSMRGSLKETADAIGAILQQALREIGEKEYASIIILPSVREIWGNLRTRLETAFAKARSERHLPPEALLKEIEELGTDGGLPKTGVFQRKYDDALLFALQQKYRRGR